MDMETKTVPAESPEELERRTTAMLEKWGPLLGRLALSEREEYGTPPHAASDFEVRKDRVLTDEELAKVVVMDPVLMRGLFPEDE